nr:MAG TPA: hypothetical protein [Caudoviricetes sp.]
MLIVIILYPSPVTVKEQIPSLLVYFSVTFSPFNHTVTSVFVSGCVTKL